MSWFKEVWKKTGGHWLDLWEDRKDMKLHDLYWYRHCEPLPKLPQARPRRLTNSEAGVYKRYLSRSSRLQLLGLPIEVRIIIWEHVFGGHQIALYRNDSRITHTLLNNDNSLLSTVDHPMHKETVQDLLMQLPKYPHVNPKKSTRRPKLKVLAILKTCRLIYSEGIKLLYTQNTFIFLQNTILSNFSEAILSERFASIRSIHVHWQCRDPHHGSRPYHPLDTMSFHVMAGHLEKMQQVDHISIHIEGPLASKTTYTALLSSLKDLAATLPRRPKGFVVRFPHPSLDVVYGDRFCQNVDTMLQDSNMPFQIIQPPLESPNGPADSDTGLDVGWRCGTFPLYESGIDNQDIVKLTYIVWTPMPRGVSWPWIP